MSSSRPAALPEGPLTHNREVQKALKLEQVKEQEGKLPVSADFPKMEIEGLGEC